MRKAFLSVEGHILSIVGEMAERLKALHPATAGFIPAMAGQAANVAWGAMTYVYVLKEQIRGRYYIGSCADLKYRVNRHKNHTGGRTTKTGDWELYCYTECESMEEARKMEKLVKSYKGGNAFRKIVIERKSDWKFM